MTALERDVSLFVNPADGRGDPDSTVRCEGCGRERRVNLGVCIAVGWPRCWCNALTMTLLSTDADIDAEVGRIIRTSMTFDRRGERRAPMTPRKEPRGVL